jgi:hypothetical protein
MRLGTVPRETKLALAPNECRFRMGIRKNAGRIEVETGKISTESPIYCPVTRRRAHRHESLAQLEFAAILLRPIAGGFHSLAQFSTASAPV